MVGSRGTANTKPPIVKLIARNQNYQLLILLRETNFMIGGFVLALPAKAIVKLRPGNVFEAFQSCCLAFCNVLLVWLAPGMLLALPRPR